MTTLAETMLVVFIIAWCVAMVADIYATRYFMPMWLVGFRKDERHKGYVRKMLIGWGIFTLAIAVGFLAGGIAEYGGGGWG